MAQILDFAAAAKARQEKRSELAASAEKPKYPRRVRLPDGRTLVLMNDKARA